MMIINSYVFTGTPSAPSNVVATASTLSSGRVSATFTDNSGGVASHNVRWRVNGGSWNTHSASPLSPGVTSTGFQTNTFFVVTDFVEVEVQAFIGANLSAWVADPDGTTV